MEDGQLKRKEEFKNKLLWQGLQSSDPSYLQKLSGLLTCLNPTFKKKLSTDSVRKDKP